MSYGWPQTPAATAVGPPPAVPARLLRRTGALLIDLALVSLVVLLGSGILTAIGGRFRHESVPWAVAAGLSILLLGAGPFAYFGLSWKRGATVGMRACQLRVVNDADGELLTLPQVILRLVGAVYSVLIGFLGFLWVLVDPRCRSWHDHYAGSRVVHEPVSPFAGSPWGAQGPWGTPGPGAAAPQSWPAPAWPPA